MAVADIVKSYDLVPLLLLIFLSELVILYIVVRLATHSNIYRRVCHLIFNDAEYSFLLNSSLQ